MFPSSLSFYWIRYSVFRIHLFIQCVISSSSCPWFANNNLHFYSLVSSTLQLLTFDNVEYVNKFDLIIHYKLHSLFFVVCDTWWIKVWKVLGNGGQNHIALYSSLEDSYQLWNFFVSLIFLYACILYTIDFVSCL